MTRSGRLVGHRILRRALLPSHAIPYSDLRSDFLRRSRASGLPQLIVGQLGRRRILSHDFWSNPDFVALGSGT
jgi:hypothetical protein